MCNEPSKPQRDAFALPRYLVRSAAKITKTKSFRRAPARFLWRGLLWGGANALHVGTLNARSERFGFSMDLPVGLGSIGSAGFFLLREYYDPVWEQLDKLLLPGQVFIDGGACQGVFSLAASTIVGETGRVIAVEPQPYGVERIKHNIARNTAINITIEPAALSDKVGEIQLASAGRVYASIRADKKAYSDHDSAIVVPTTTIDALAQKHGCDVNVIKYNINGAEADSLRGAKATIARCRPIIAIVMFDPDIHDVVEFQEILGPLGYGEHMIEDETLRPRDNESPPHNNVIYIHETAADEIYARFAA